MPETPCNCDYYGDGNCYVHNENHPTRQIERLTQENERLLARINESREAWYKRVKELEAQLAVVREAFDGRESGEVTMQMLNDIGINPFAVQLVCESFARLERPLPIKFKFNNIVFILGANFDPVFNTTDQQVKQYEDERKTATVRECIRAVTNQQHNWAGDDPEWLACERILEDIKDLLPPQQEGR